MPAEDEVLFNYDGEEDCHTIAHQRKEVLEDVEERVPSAKSAGEGYDRRYAGEQPAWDALRKAAEDLEVEGSG
ncbi:hypothetical protein ABVK25_000565 [Lepraria finkii]|uniref:Uncharacterized protein n=1 Tax=Lepraria finkii TaxID=1340010 RepID=A0ABR4BS29_9LECA